MDENTSGLPWAIELEQYHRARRLITIVSARGIVCRVGDTTMPKALEDAKLIVAAVNAQPNYNELVALCTSILECLEQGDVWAKPARLHAAGLLRTALEKVATNG